MGKASAPVDAQTMLLDQQSRASALGYNWWDSGDNDDNITYIGTKGDPFFTQTHRPRVDSITSKTRAPFLFSGNNKSLRTAYNNTYNQYYAGVPESASFNDTWHGPAINPTYGSTGSNGLNALGTARYWQDNNNNQLFEQATDDYLPELPANYVDTPQAQPQSADFTTGFSTPFLGSLFSKSGRERTAFSHAIGEAAYQEDEKEPEFSY